MSNSRIYVQSGIAPAFIRAFTQLFTSRVPGDPKQAGTTLGPLVDELAHSSVTAFLNSARKEGGTIIDARNAGEGGKARVDVQDVPGQGFYIRPTILMDLDDDARCVREEIFGPVREGLARRSWQN